MKLSRLQTLPLALTSLILLSACSGSGTTTTLDTEPSVAIEIPGALRNLNALNIRLIHPNISLSNGTTLSMNRGVDEYTWEGEALIPANERYTATILWVENYAGEGDISLMRQTMDLDIDGQGNVTQSNISSYFTDFDTDNDGVSNVQERLNGTNPKDDQNFDTSIDTPLTMANVIVPRVASETAPTVDGSGVYYDNNGWLTEEWATAVQLDNSGAPLLIAPQIRTENDDPAPHWAALHDGNYIYLVVSTEHDTPALVTRRLDLRFSGHSMTSLNAESVLMPVLNDETQTAAWETTHEGIDVVTSHQGKQAIYEIRVNIASAKLMVNAPTALEFKISQSEASSSATQRWIEEDHTLSHTPDETVISAFSSIFLLE